MYQLRLWNITFVSFSVSLVDLQGLVTLKSIDMDSKIYVFSTICKFMAQQIEYKVPDLVMSVKTIFAFEFADALFNHDSAVMLPSESAGLSVIADVYVFVDENPDRKLIVTGNTDTCRRISLSQSTKGT